MCGICGKLSPGGVHEAEIRTMTSSLSHRGPDEEGVYLRNGVGLGHRRLSIIDLATGKQPMANEDDSVWIVFNGEIYNYQQLRPELIGKGHCFKTSSDTEVILHLYEEYGPACVERLRGMFAFAIWDMNRKRLFAVRDRLGQKPFYYAHHGKQLIFGSEIKSLLAADPSLAEMDLRALDQYLTLRVIAPPYSSFCGIRKLPPAHWLTFDTRSGRLDIQRYWDLAYEPKNDGSDEHLVDQLEAHLIECLKLHMVADVPIGAFMSGGLDSTLLVAMAVKHGLTDAIETFSMGLPGRFNEAPYARLVAEKYATRHHEQVMTPSLLNTLPQLIWHLDEPSDPLAVCQYLICQRARTSVKAVWCGDGGDELFGGYDRYYGNRYTQYYATVPYVVRRYVCDPVLKLIPDGNWYKSVAHQAKWMNHLSFFQGGRRYAKSLGYFYFTEPLRRELYGRQMRDAIEGFDPEVAILRPFERVQANDMLDRMFYADLQVRLPDHPVMILDRMAMAHGLEARSPFMDHKIAEFAASLPVRMKIRGRQTRFIQRQLAKRYLPGDLLTLGKQGFSCALPYMLKNEYKLLFKLFLRNSQLVRNKIFVQQPIDRLLHEHLTHAADHGNRLWLLLNSEVWYRMFILRQTVQDLTDEIHEAVLHPRGRSASRTADPLTTPI